MPEPSGRTPDTFTEKAFQILRSRPPLREYVLTTGYVFGAFLLTIALGKRLPIAIFPLFFAAVMLGGWRCGLWPGVLSTALSLPLLRYAKQFGGTESPGTALDLAVFCSVSLLINVLNALRCTVEAKLRQSQHELETRVAGRTEELANSNAALTQEVIERRRAEQTLRQSEENYRSLFEDAPIAYHEIDRDGTVIRVNRAELQLLGYESDELIGKPVWSLVAPEQREQSQRHISAKIAGDELPAPFFRVYVRNDGERVHVEIHEKVIRDGAGRVVGIRSSLLDISERLAAEERIQRMNAELEHRVLERTLELQRSNEALQQFAYSASHDLQEPLRMVLAYTKLIEQRYSHHLDEDGREFLHFIVDGAERMTQMIRDLLAFSRAGRTNSAQLEEIPMNEVVSTAVANLQASVEETQAKIEWSDLPVVCGRRAGLAQVLQNLVGNSLKYKSDVPPFVRITAETTLTEWIFCVADNGLGFRQEFAEKVFGIFQRLHGSAYKGTGMGLAICKRIIERNGGRMWAESVPGQGSKFYFALPFPISRAGERRGLAESAPTC